MGDTPSIEELQSQLEQLRKENLQREIEAERLKAEEALKKEKEAEEQKLREDIKAEVLAEMKGKSKVDEQTGDSDITTMNSGNQEWENFKEQYTKRSGLEGLSYDGLCHKAYTDSMYR